MSHRCFSLIWLYQDLGDFSHTKINKKRSELLLPLEEIICRCAPLSLLQDLCWQNVT
jgi:hypothetical protein